MFGKKKENKNIDVSSLNEVIVLSKKILKIAFFLIIIIGIYAIIMLLKELNTRIELLTKRNIRDKLLSYFDILSANRLYKTITIPFSFTDLADYLSVDRSAMMRELGHLKEDGLIQKTGGRIKLLY